MTKTEAKHAAQDALMAAMQDAMTLAGDGECNEAPEAVREAMLQQFRRIEKFLGYEPGSWPAGA